MPSRQPEIQIMTLFLFHSSSTACPYFGEKERLHKPCLPNLIAELTSAP
ncbi:hypothetical protein SynROS8604_01017 [Synechococcus sp. ROS8604]|nr:hypothetical protein SynROS8604_01017 [Synechococcus sp. ROS8604]